MEQPTAQKAEDRYWAASCYVPVLNVVTAVLTIVRKSNLKFCVFHAKNGLVLFAMWFATIVMGLFSPTLSLMLWGASLLLHVLGGLSAYSGKEVSIPVVTDLAAKIPEQYLFETLTGRVNKEMRTEMKQEAKTAEVDGVVGVDNQVEVSDEVTNNESQVN